MRTLDAQFRYLFHSLSFHISSRMTAHSLKTVSFFENHLLSDTRKAITHLGLIENVIREAQQVGTRAEKLSGCDYHPDR